MELYHNGSFVGFFKTQDDAMKCVETFTEGNWKMFDSTGACVAYGGFARRIQK